MFDLKGRHALVTGAARGIGLDIVRVLGECGATVQATDIDLIALESATEGLRAKGLAVTAAALDVTSPDAWRTLLGDIERSAGRLDILVNNAGIMLSKPFMQMSLAEYQQTQRINVESVFIGIQSAFPLMSRTAQTQAAGGSIINLSSIYGQIGGDMNAAYSASKGAVRLLTKALAVEFGRTGAKLRVNSVHPGGVDTDLGRGGLKAFIDHGVLPDMAAAAALIQMSTPLGRIAQVDDVSGVVAFLASDAAKFMTGTEVTIDGGFSIV